MNEINNNIPHILPNISANPKKVNDANVPQPKTEIAADVVPDNGYLGKSQVAKPDNIQSDIDFCIKQSPEFLAKCDNFFEQSFNSLSASGEEFAYEKACVLTKEFANEFA